MLTLPPSQNHVKTRQTATASLNFCAVLGIFVHCVRSLWETGRFWKKIASLNFQGFAFMPLWGNEAWVQKVSFCTSQHGSQEANFTFEAVSFRAVFIWLVLKTINKQKNCLMLLWRLSTIAATEDVSDAVYLHLLPSINSASLCYPVFHLLDMYKYDFSVKRSSWDREKWESIIQQTVKKSIVLNNSDTYLWSCKRIK